MRERSVKVALVLLLASMTAAEAQTVPCGFTVDTLLTTGFGPPSNPEGWGPSGPMDFAFLPDGRMLVALKTGEVKLHLPGTSSFTVIGTIPAIDTTSGRGLTGLCLDPQVLANGYLYAVANRTDGMIWLMRFTLVGALNDPSGTNLALSDQHDLLAAPDDHIFHNSGPCRFGPDGMLYVPFGDDAAPCETQDRTSLIGVLLRLDVGGIPAGPGGPAGPAMLDPGDNPFSSSANANERLVIAWGLRMPFSMCIDPVTGDLFIGDVGEDTREELDWFPRNLPGPVPALNYGWPWREGLASHVGCPGTQPTGLVDPIDDFPHTSTSPAIMCAGVIRNAGRPFDFGPAYEFNVFHNDHSAGTLERLVLDPATGTWSTAPPVSGQPSPTHWGAGFVTAHRFDQGPDGALYFLQRTPAALKRIRQDPSPKVDGTQPGGPGGPVWIENRNLVSGREYYNVFSVAPCSGTPGTGPYLGLCAPDPTPLLIQFLLPVGALPVHFIAQQSEHTFGPYPVSPMTVDAICFDFTGGALGAVSCVTRFTVF